MSQRLPFSAVGLWCGRLNIQGPIFMEREGECVYVLGISISPLLFDSQHSCPLSCLQTP